MTIKMNAMFSMYYWFIISESGNHELRVRSEATDEEGCRVRGRVFLPDILTLYYNQMRLNPTESSGLVITADTISSLTVPFVKQVTDWICMGYSHSPTGPLLFSSSRYY